MWTYKICSNKLFSSGQPSKWYMADWMMYLNPYYWIQHLCSFSASNEPVMDQIKDMFRLASTYDLEIGLAILLSIILIGLFFTIKGMRTVAVCRINRNHAKNGTIYSAIENAFSPQFLQAVFFSFDLFDEISPGEAIDIVDYIRYLKRQKNVPVYCFVEGRCVGIGYFITSSVGKIIIASRLSVVGYTKFLVTGDIILDSDMNLPIEEINKAYQAAYKQQVKATRESQKHVYLGQVAAKKGLVNQVGQLYQVLNKYYRGMKIVHVEG